MKLTKKLTTILFAFMMVLTTTTMVFAEEGSTPGTKGKITIDNAISGETYQIYKILSLESFDTTNGRYAYTIDETSGWAEFIRTGEGKNYFAEDENKYVTWKAEKTDAKYAEFAAKALAYARNNQTLKRIAGKTASAGTNVVFDNLELGYYLVDSGVGALCSLDTTQSTVTIKEKNDIPELSKKVDNSATGTFTKDTNSASFGDTVYFRTTITAKPGAQNYVLYDTMDAGFTLLDGGAGNYVTVKSGDTVLTKDTDYTFTNTPGAGESWTFKIEFAEAFLKALRDELGTKAGGKTKNITVEYKAMVNENAKIIGSDGTTNANKAKLSYGDNKNTEEVGTHTTVCLVKVFKYYLKDGAETGLGGAKFELKDKGGTVINLVKLADETDVDGKVYSIYRKKIDTDTNSTAMIESPASGYIKIKGLATGEYSLTEKAAPNGFNVLKKAVDFQIDEHNNYSIKDTGGSYKPVGVVPPQIKIENKTGTLLPSTGGVGTTMMYIVGAALLIGSGVLLITKKNAK